jgi:hypothetical protein
MTLTSLDVYRSRWSCPYCCAVAIKGHTAMVSVGRGWSDRNWASPRRRCACRTCGRQRKVERGSPVRTIILSSKKQAFLMFLIGRLSVNESSGGHASMPPQVMRSLLPAHQCRSFSDCQQRSAISHLGRAIAKLADEPMRFRFLIWFRSRSSCSLQLQHAVLHVDARGVAAGFSPLYQNFARAQSVPQGNWYLVFVIYCLLEENRDLTCYLFATSSTHFSRSSSAQKAQPTP